MGNINLSYVEENAEENAEIQKYTLKCTNNSTADWTFYVYQKMPNQAKEIFSLAWFASPSKIALGGSHIQFDWTIDYSFVWGRSGIVIPGVDFSAGGEVPCTPSGDNLTTFGVEDGTPRLSPAVSGGEADILTVKVASNVPNQTYSAGIGMSGQGAFAQQALQNTTQLYTLEPKYYIAAASSMQSGAVLAQTINDAKEVKFPSGVYDLYASIGEDNQWTISREPITSEHLCAINE
ncbi:MAG: hypothetical protein ACI8WB_004183 [Phenylobacterium sp.]|jgi:hypothetical protein